jgi:pimeloyl-ACP methyl ester carboxylesterase
MTKGRRRRADPWRDGFVETNGVRLHYVTQGRGPLMLFLHGFPDFWFGWRHQIPEFARDHTVVALDMRGYNDSDKPAERNAYRVTEIVADVAGVIDQLGGGRAILVGHDWGGAIAWATANSRPDLLDRLVIMNLPHPALLARALRRPVQMLRSSYMLFFQLPLIPELALTANNAALVAQVFRGALIDKDAISEAELDRYREAMLKPGAATAQLNYYRNLFRPGGSRRFKKISTPTLLIWGERDVVLGKELTYGTEEYVSDLTIRYIPDCGHFVQQEKPRLVNAAMRAWLARASPARNTRRPPKGSK